MLSLDQARLFPTLDGKIRSGKRLQRGVDVDQQALSNG
jgi:hypothetical protein